MTKNALNPIMNPRLAAGILTLCGLAGGSALADTIIGGIIGGDSVVLKTMDLPTLANEKPFNTIAFNAEQTRPEGLLKASDGTILLNQVSAAKSQLIDLGTAAKPKVGGEIGSVVALSADKTLASAVANDDGSYLALASINGIANYSLVNLDGKTGAVVNLGTFKSVKSGRLANLTRCPGGDVYATSMSKEGGVSLVKIDMAAKKMTSIVDLKFDNHPLGSDLKALVCAPGPLFYGLADPLYSGSNALFGLNVTTGDLNFIKFTKLDWMVRVD